MPTESIVFDPLIPDRELDQQADKVDQRLAESGQINPELGEVQGELGLDGIGGVGGGGGGMGLGGGAGRAGAAAGLASRIPKPVAGVTAGAALPAALVGGVGVGLLSAMQGASARLKTSTTLLGQAWNNVFRPLGDDLDKLFVRDLVQDLVDITEDFEETYRNDGRGEAIQDISVNLGTLISENVGDAIANEIRNSVGGQGGDILGDAIEDAFSNFNAQKAFSSPVGAIEQVINSMTAATKSVFDDIKPWPGWPSVKADWPGWPSLDKNDLLDELDFGDVSSSDLMDKVTINTITASAFLAQPNWKTITASKLLDQVDIKPIKPMQILRRTFGEPLSANQILATMFPTLAASFIARRVFSSVNGNQILTETFGGVHIDGGDVLGETFGNFTIGKSDLLDFITGSGPTEDDDDDEDLEPIDSDDDFGDPEVPPEENIPGTRPEDPYDPSDDDFSGPADPRRGPGREPIDDPNDDDLIPGVDVPGDRTYGTASGLQREMEKTRKAVESMSIQVDSETLGRVTSDARREEVTDTDPLVR